MASTLEQIQAKVKKLQAQAEAIIASNSKAALNQIHELMAKHGLTTADIDTHIGSGKNDKKRSAGKAAVARTKIVSQTKGKLPAKYLNPKTGETWSGRARPPLWIANVKDRTKFLIDIAGTAIDGASKTEKASAVVLKGAIKGKQQAKYLDPASGATWSGYGPAPAWLAGAKDRTKFLIDGTGTAVAGSYLVDKSKAAGKSSATAKKAATRKAAVTRKAVGNGKLPTKKALAKKAPTKKAVARKVPEKKAVTVPEADATPNP